MVGTARDEAAPLLSRHEEQRLLTSLLDDVATRGQSLVLRGEPGIGKSRLLSECERTARERGMAVLRTTGVQSEAHLPFAGLHAADLPAEDAAFMADSQVPWGVEALGGLIEQAAQQALAATRETVG
jgi:hypothetical protein